MLSLTLYAFASVFVVSLISFTGLLFLALKPRTLKKLLLELVAFSVGGLLGGVFFHLLPETVAELGFTPLVAVILLSGFFFTFVTEKFIHWHHCHGTHCDHHVAKGVKPFAIINLLGDGVHNFIDGVVIAAAYFVSVPVGLATTVAVVLHEIPQEIGDFAVLVHGGFSRGKALLWNFVSALAAFLGVAATLLLRDVIQGFIPYVLPFAAGTFLYLAGTDLIPELHKETRPSRSVAQLLAIIAGTALMGLLLLVG